MELGHYFDIIFRRKWIILLTTLVTTAIAVIGTLLMRPTYQATTTLRVITATRGSIDFVNYETGYSDRLMNTYARVATSRPMLETIAKNLNGRQLPAVRTSITGNSELLQITAEGPDPELDAETANALADLLIAYVEANDNTNGAAAVQALDKQTSQSEDELNQARQDYATLVSSASPNAEALASSARLVAVKQESYRVLLELNERVRAMQSIRNIGVNTIEPAVVPHTPIQPKKELNITMGFLIGLLGGLALTFVMENLGSALPANKAQQQATRA